MKPHPRIRKTVKWGGLVLAALLAGIWVLATMGSGGASGRLAIPGRPVLVVVALTGGMVTSVWFPQQRASGTRFEFEWQWHPSPVRFGFFIGELNGRYFFAVSPGILILLASGAAAVAWRRDAQAQRAFRTDLCPSCQHSRAGLAADAVCPECGIRPSAAARAAADRFDRWWFRRTRSVVRCGAAVVAVSLAYLWWQSDRCAVHWCGPSVAPGWLPQVVIGAREGRFVVTTRQYVSSAGIAPGLTFAPRLDVQAWSSEATIYERPGVSAAPLWIPTLLAAGVAGWLWRFEVVARRARTRAATAAEVPAQANADGPAVAAPAAPVDALPRHRDTEAAPRKPD